MLGLNLVEALARVAGRRDDPARLAGFHLAASGDARDALRTRNFHAVMTTK